MNFDLSFLINNAFAQAAEGAAKQPSILESMLPIIMIVGVFYFLIIRPQSKKVKEHQALLSTVTKGDRIVTTGGIFGTIVKVDKDTNTILVEIAETVKIKIKQDAIAEIIKDTPATA